MNSSSQGCTERLAPPFHFSQVTSRGMGHDPVRPAMDHEQNSLGCCPFLDQTRRGCCPFFGTPNPCQANKLGGASASFQNLVNLIPGSIKRGKPQLFSQKSWGSWGREGRRGPARNLCIEETQLNGQWPRTFHVYFQPLPGDSQMPEEPLIQTRCL